MHTGVVAATGESRHFLHAFEATVFFHAEFAQRGDPLDLGKFFENLADSREGPWKIEVGGVDPTHDLPCGLGEAFVDGIILASIFLAAPESESAGMTLDNFATAVGRSAIDNDILQVRPTTIRREKDAADRLVQVRGLIVGRGDDGNFHEQMNEANVFIRGAQSPALGALMICSDVLQSTPVLNSLILHNMLQANGESYSVKNRSD